MIYFPGVRLKSNLQNPNRYPADHSDDHFFIATQIKFCYYPQNDAMVKEIGNRFVNMVLLQPKSSVLKLICRHSALGYNLHSIKVGNPRIDDLALNYGSAFVDVHQNIFKELSKKDGKGLVLLHGIPGSGESKRFATRKSLRS